MEAGFGATTLQPRWLNAIWVWLPVAAGLLLFSFVAVVQVDSGSGFTWWVPAGVACSAALAIRERWPVAALGATLLAVGATRLPGANILGPDFDVVYLLLLLVPMLPLFSVASRLRLRSSSLALVACIVVTVAVSPDPFWTVSTVTTQAALVGYVLNLGLPVMFALAAWLAGCAVLARQRYAEVLLERAATVERTRDAEQARAVLEERTRIARELHDVVSHSVAVMLVQSSAAEALWDRDPQQARASLRAVEETGRTVMTDLRGMLGTLRTEPSPGERQAAVGVEQLSKLADQIRRTGLSAHLTASGAAGEIGDATSLSLFRIAQESVTNALRHANASTIAIDLVVGGETVQMSIADDGVGTAALRAGGDALDPLRAGGHGLVGMRERASAIGGTLEIRSNPAGGTTVIVRAPLRRAVVA